MSLKYRSDIDGLRAVAVLPVIFFHADIPGFTGGFVGVDVFFVISGYLITSIILDDISGKGFSIARFYERRIRRIFPAFFPVIAFSFVLSGFLFYSKSFKLFGESVTAATLFYSNILFWRTAGYFDAASITKPLMHTWSLSVEEQFYIFFPLLLVAINRFFGSRYFFWLLCLWFLSFTVSVVGVYIYPIPTFYLMPTRAWELLTGSVLALGYFPLVRSRFQQNILSIIGLALILFSVFFYSEDTLFPGVMAVMPVFGSALVIYAGIERVGFVQKLLSFKPIVYIGLISYSLYLWHWPILVFVKYLLFRDLFLYEAFALILLSFIVSMLSYKFIEQPFRGPHLMVPDRKMLFGLAVIVMFFVSTAGYIVSFLNGIPSRYSASETYVDNMAKDMKTDSQWLNYDKNRETISELDKGAKPAIIGNDAAVPSFVLWGDSHAKSLVAAIEKSASEYGLSGYDIAHGNVIRPLLDVQLVGYGMNEDVLFNRSVIDFIRNDPEIKVVIMAGFWSVKRKLRDVSGEYPGRQSSEVLLEAGLHRSVKAVLALGRKVVLVADIPILKDDPHRFLYVASRFGKKPDFNIISETLEEYRERNEENLIVLNELSSHQDVVLVRLDSMLFDKDKGLKVIDDNVMFYVDDDHLTTAGSRYLSPVFDGVFSGLHKSM